MSDNALPLLLAVAGVGAAVYFTSGEAKAAQPQQQQPPPGGAPPGWPQLPGGFPTIPGLPVVVPGQGQPPQVPPVSIPADMPPLVMYRNPDGPYPLRSQALTFAHAALQPLPESLAAVVADQWVMASTPESAQPLQALAAWLQAKGYQQAAQVTAGRAAELPGVAQLAPWSPLLDFDGNLPAQLRGSILANMLLQRRPVLANQILPVLGGFPRTAATVRALSAGPYDQPTQQQPPVPGVPVPPGFPVPGQQPPTTVPASWPQQQPPQQQPPQQQPPQQQPPAGGAPPGWPQGVPWPGFWPPGVPFPTAPPGGVPPIPGGVPGGVPGVPPGGVPGVPPGGAPPGGLVLPKGAQWDAGEGVIRYMIQNGDVTVEIIAKRFGKKPAAAWVPSALAMNPGRNWKKSHVGDVIRLHQTWGIPGALPPSKDEILPFSDAGAIKKAAAQVKAAKQGAQTPPPKPADKPPPQAAPKPKQKGK